MGWAILRFCYVTSSIQDRKSRHSIVESVFFFCHGKKQRSLRSQITKILSFESEQLMKAAGNKLHGVLCPLISDEDKV